MAIFLRTVGSVRSGGLRRIATMERSRMCGPTGAPPTSAVEVRGVGRLQLG
jgi:hypothetical protein